MKRFQIAVLSIIILACGWRAVDAAFTAGLLVEATGANTTRTVTLSGDVTYAQGGAITIANSAVTNAKVSASAAIDVTKLGTGGTIPANSGANLTALNATSLSSGTVAAARGGTGVSNSGTITNASNTTITGGGTLALGGFTLTAPATGTAALLGTANTFTAANSFQAGSGNEVTGSGAGATLRSLATTVSTKAAGNTWSYSCDANNLITLTVSSAHGIQRGQTVRMAGWAAAVAALGDFQAADQLVCYVPSATSIVFNFGSAGVVGSTNINAGTDTGATITPRVAGGQNSGSGIDAISSMGSLSGTTGFGYAAAKNIINESNTAFGNNAMSGVDSGLHIRAAWNSAFGNAALLNIDDGDGDAAFGFNALRYITNGSYNSGLGANVGATLTTGNGNLLLGAAADTAAASTSNTLVAGSVAYPLPDIYFGQGMTAAAPADYTLHGTKSTTNGTAGGGITIAGGLANQAADAGGAITLKTAPAGTGTMLAAVLTAQADGSVAIPGKTAGAVVKLGANAVSIFIQDATPTAIATDDRWYETDSNIVWYWNGTYWLSTELFTVRCPAQIGAGAGITDYITTEYWQASQFNIYLVDLIASWYVSTTNNGTNYWRWTIARISAGNVTTDISSITSAAITADTWTVTKGAVNTLLDLSTDIKVLKPYTNIGAGAPGGLYAGCTLTYRLAHQ